MKFNINDGIGKLYIQWWIGKKKNQIIFKFIKENANEYPSLMYTL